MKPPSPQGHSSSPTAGAIAGVTVGVVLALGLIVLAITLLRRRQQKKMRDRTMHFNRENVYRKTELDATVSAFAEAPDGKRRRQNASELDGSFRRVELPAQKGSVEIADTRIYEMESGL